MTAQRPTTALTWPNFRQSWLLVRGTPLVQVLLSVRQKIRVALVRQSVRQIWGGAALALRPHQATVVCLVRDGEYYIRSFVEHYTRLGVRQIVLLDNGSRDRTVELASAYENVTVLQSQLPYKRYQYAMKEYLLTSFGVGGWRLHVDIDELFDYPHSDGLPLEGLLSYLNAGGYNAMVGHLLDMFNEQVPRRHSSAVDHDLRACYPYYDLSNLLSLSYSKHYKKNHCAAAAMQVLRGGIRRTLFGTSNGLTKHPLVRLDGRLRLRENLAHDVYHANVADVSAVLYHYKFTERFIEQTEQAVREENYYLGSSEYKCYQAVIADSEALQIRQPTSRRLEGPNELVAQGFLLVSPKYLAWQSAHAPLCV